MMRRTGGSNKKMEVKLLGFFSKDNFGLYNAYLVWMSVMIQEWNNSWIANTVILYVPNLCFQKANYCSNSTF